MINIKDTSGKVVFSTPVNKGAKAKLTLMKEDYVTLPFVSDRFLDFKPGCYVDLSDNSEYLNGRLAKIYEVTGKYRPVPDNENGGFRYLLRLDAYYIKWKNKIFRYLPEGHGQEASWTLTAPLSVHLDVFVRNLIALKYKYRGSNFQYSIDAGVSDKAVTLSYSNTNMLDALTMMAEALECEWWITDNVIHFGRCEFGDPVRIELFKEASSMARSESKGSFATRIYAFGSEKNIPANYRPADETMVVNGIVQRRLMLPEGTPYLDAYPNMPEEEAVEAVVVFDEVYPHMVGTMSDVSTYTSTVENEDGTQTTETFYRYKDMNLNFSEDYILKGQTLKIKFESGLMNGMTFEVKFNPTTKDDKQWEIVQNEDYGRKLPDNILYPKNGDKYVLFGYDTSFVAANLMTDAELELKEEAQAWLDKAKVDDSTFTVPLYSDWVEADKLHRTFDVGQRINLINEAYFENGRISRVIGWEFNLDIPTDSPTYVIGESPAYSRLGALEEKIDNITFKGFRNSAASRGGGGGPYVIRLNDSTPPSEANVFSSAKSLEMFHRKDKSDRTEHLQTFGKGADFGDFVPDTSGGAVHVDGQGKTHAEFDFLKIRREALFAEVTIQDAKHVGGELVVSPAAMVVSKVEELADGWKLYFNATDSKGRTIVNDFIVDDQARCKTYNLTTNHYWWRLVTEIGEDFIVVSKSDMDTGSDAPRIGDNVAQLGNRTDDRRQSAQVISAYGDDAPSIKMYQGIDSYSLVGKMVKGEYYDAVTNRIKSVTYGDAYVGATDRSSYMEFTQEQGLRLKGKMEIAPGSTGWENFDGLKEQIGGAYTEVGGQNLLLNTGFTGDYSTTEMTTVTPETDTYSDNLKYWNGQGNVVKDGESLSGFACHVTKLRQDLRLIQSEKYTVSLKAKGATLKVMLNKEEVSFALTPEYKRYTYQFTGEHDSNFELIGDATVCEVKLERGTVATDWCPHVNDKNPLADEMRKMWYLLDALKGTTSIDGGAILTSVIRFGQWQDGVMQKVNGGMSGIYNDDEDVAFFAGGDLDKAIYTVSLYRHDPSYEPTADELANIANCVITHGGRAYLNDVILRGYVYAEGGVFRGKVYASDGEFRGKVSATSGSFNDVEVSSVYSKNGNFTIDAEGNVAINDLAATNGTFTDIYAVGGTFENINLTNVEANGGRFNNIEAQGGTFNDITAAGGTFNDIKVNRIASEGGTFKGMSSVNGTFKEMVAEGGTFKNIKFSESVNTATDNFYIDKLGNVWLKSITADGGTYTNVDVTGKITATSGSIDNVMVSNIASKNGSFSIDADGNATLNNITSDKGTFTNVSITSGTFEGNITLGNDVTKINSDGTAYFGKYGASPAYLTINKAGAEFSGKVSASGGKFGDDLFIHPTGISTNKNQFEINVEEGITNFSVSREYLYYTTKISGYANSIKICPNYTDGGILTISATSTTRDTALYIRQGKSIFDDLVRIDTPNNQALDVIGYSKFAGNTELHPDEYGFTDVHGACFNVREITTNGDIRCNDDIIKVRNSSQITLNLPSAKPGKWLIVKQMTETGCRFANGGILEPLSTTPNWNFALAHHAHTLLLFHLGNREWMAVFGWV